MLAKGALSNDDHTYTHRARAIIGTVGGLSQYRKQESA